MDVIYLGHACFALESEGFRVVIDPYEGVDGYPPLKTDAHALYCSHGHFDHSAAGAVRLLDGKENPFSVTEIPTFHDDQNGALRGENTVRVFAAEGLRVAHLGDLGHPLDAAQRAALGAVDVLLLPVGGTYTVTAAEAKEVADAVGAGIVVPMHYRRGQYGFSVLQEVEDFLSLYPANMVKRLAGNRFTVEKSPSARVLLPLFRE